MPNDLSRLLGHVGAPRTTLSIERGMQACISSYRYKRPWRQATMRLGCDVPAYGMCGQRQALRRLPQRWHVCEAPTSNRARFDQAVTALRGELLRYMRRRIRNPDTAADLTQETLLRMLYYRDASDIQSYTLLLYRIAHNVVLAHGRMRRSQRMGQHVSLEVAGPLAASGASVEQCVDARRTLQRLHRHTLVTLPPRCRQAFALNRFEGLTYPEVAAVMGISVKMVEKHLHRALAARRAAVE
ncbi:RNA polymerase sigma factor [Xanthomonas arboricola]|uniref:RNA polymerase sigma factor n=1 Tax=Xanthomonas arboricola TaxID=56448 RepID=UPI0036DDA534